jgi:formylglycine-generating enzyme required for sulfatase activity
LYTFREPSLGRQVHRELMRSAVLDLTPIIPATACYQRNYVERYSRFNEREGCGDYRLPTEAQWEYACRAGTTGPRYHPDVKAIAWYVGHGNAGPQPVGRKPPNAWGLYDMLGNVWEWCRDGRRTYTADAMVDPLGPTGIGTSRVGRGGSWRDSRQFVVASLRYEIDPSTRSIDLGFRCACSGRQR